MKHISKIMCALTVVVLLSGLFLTDQTVSAMESGHLGGPLANQGPRAMSRTPSLVIDDGSTVTLDANSVDYYQNITVTNGSSLIIQDTTITVEQYVYLNESSHFSMNNANLKIEGENIGGKSFWGDGIASFEIEDSEIRVQGKSNPGPLGTAGDDGQYGGNGENAMFKLEINSDPVTFSNSKILVTAGSGGNGQDAASNPSGTGYKGGDGGEGGNALLIINSTNEELELESCQFQATAGDGGEGGKYGTGMTNGQSGDGGCGGTATIMFHTDKGGVNILNSRIEGFGGSGGKGGYGYDYGGKGGDWGIAEVYASTTSVGSKGVGIYLEDSIINATRGSYGLGGQAQNGASGTGGNNDGSDIDNSRLDFTMNSLDFKDSILWSSYYYFTTQATIQSDLENITIASQGDAHWSLTGSIELSFLEELTVFVKGEDGTALENAKVKITNKEESTISQTAYTKADGRVMLKAPGRIVRQSGSSPSDEMQSYNIEVNYRDIVKKRQVQLNEPKTEDFSYPLITISMNKDDITPPVIDNKVGETVTIRGTTSTPYSTPIEFVKISIQQVGSTGDPLWQDVTDTGTAFSTWEYVWDTNESFDDTEYVITAWASDGILSANTTMTLTVDQDVVNHPPLVKFTTENGASFSIGGIGEERMITITGTVTDPDSSSGTGAGHEIQSMSVMFLKADKTPVEEKAQWVNINELNVGTWSDTNGTWEIQFDGGNRLKESDKDYCIRVRAFDGKLYSKPADLIIHLHIRYSPSLVVTDVISGTHIRNQDRIEIKDDGNKKGDAIIHLSTQGSSSGMEVSNPNYSNIQFRYVVTDSNGKTIDDTGWVDNTDYKYEITSEPKDIYKDEDIFYYAQVYVKNADNETSTIRIEILDKYKARELPDDGIFKVFSRSQRSMLSMSLIALIIIMNILGAVLMVFENSSIEKKRKAQIAHVKASIEKKKKKERSAQQESIYSIEMGREASIYETAQVSPGDVAYESPLSSAQNTQEATYDYATTRSQSAYTQPRVDSNIVYSHSQPQSAPAAPRLNRCPKCGAPVQPNWIICPNCHTKLR